RLDVLEQLGRKRMASGVTADCGRIRGVPEEHAAALRALVVRVEIGALDGRERPVAPRTRGVVRLTRDETRKLRAASRTRPFSERPERAASGAPREFELDLTSRT